MNLSIKTGLLAVAVLGLVSGCGGGGGGGTASVVSGVAATGAAIASGSVTLKCVSGTTTAVTTGTDGSFSIDVSTVTLPCVGRVDYRDGTGTAQKLHTFISTAGTANVTPVTELLVASLTGAAAADAFDRFDAAKTRAFTAAQVKAAATAVKTYLRTTLGVDTSNLPDDPVGTRFVAQTGSNSGDAFDKVLDELKAKLATAGKTLGAAAGEVAQTSGNGGATVAAGSAAGTGLYTGVTAQASSAFLTLLNTACTTKVAGAGGALTYSNCTQNNASAAVSLVATMWLGGLPYVTGSDIVTGPSSVSPGTATVTLNSGMAGVTMGNSCSVVIAEPLMSPVQVQVLVNGSNYFSSGSFDFRGTANDTVMVTGGGVVAEYTMTNNLGNKIEVHPNLALFGGGQSGAEAAVQVIGSDYYLCK